MLSFVSFVSSVVDVFGRNWEPRLRGFPEGPMRCFELWLRMRLDAGQREELGREMTVLLQRYSQLEAGAGAKDLLVHAAFAPRRRG